MPTTARRIAAAIAVLAAVSSTAAQASGPLALYYERMLMSTAGTRCDLFSPDVASALSAATVQARGAALRAGANGKTLAAVRRRAELKAYGVACKGEDIATAAERVRVAFAGYGKIWKMSFPGDNGGWDADRAEPGKQGGPRWRLVQNQGPVRFGLLADQAGQNLTAVFPSAPGASGARLVLRDPAKAPAPYLDARKPGLKGALPPRASSVVILASDMGPAPEALGGGVAFAFPGSAEAALAKLDPREAVAVELVFPTRTGERTRSVLMEVGDFAAGKAFLAAR